MELEKGKNQKQFKSRKSIQLSSSLLKAFTQPTKTEKTSSKKINKSNRSISYCTRIRKKVLDKMDKKKSEKNMIPQRAALQIANICNNIGDQYKKKSGDIKNMEMESNINQIYPHSPYRSSSSSQNHYLNINAKSYMSPKLYNKIYK